MNRSLLSLLGLSLWLFCAAGCMSSHMTSTSVDGPEYSAKYRGGLYYVQYCDDALKKELLKIQNKDRRPVFAARDVENAVPIQITIGNMKPKKSALEPLVQCNNFLSVCTIGLWPWMKSELYVREMTVTCGQLEKKFTVETTHRSWTSLVLPFAFIPVPGWADARTTCVEPDMTDTCNLPLLSDKVLAEAIARCFSKKEYSEALTRRRRCATMEELIDFNVVEERNTLLMPYALQECPKLWETIEKLRAEITKREERIESFKKSLMTLGVAPEKDQGYLKLCDGRYQLIMLFKNAYGQLEQHYLSAQARMNSAADEEVDKLKAQTLKCDKAEDQKTVPEEPAPTEKKK